MYTFCVFYVKRAYCVNKEIYKHLYTEIFILILQKGNIRNILNLVTCCMYVTSKLINFFWQKGNGLG